MIKKSIIVAVLLGILDYIWLYFIFQNTWRKMITNIQLTPMKLNTTYIIPAYILMTLSIVIFVIPKINSNNILKDSILYGGCMGLIIYGIFDLTNLIVFKNYSKNIAFMDITWGTLLFIITTYLSKKILISFEN
mgnify:CR=1 FL=1